MQITIKFISDYIEDINFPKNCPYCIEEREYNTDDMLVGHISFDDFGKPIEKHTYYPPTDLVKDYRENTIAFVKYDGVIQDIIFPENCSFSVKVEFYNEDGYQLSKNIYSLQKPYPSKIKDKKIYIYVDGGVVQDIVIPDDCEYSIVVRDYDIDGCDEKNLIEDEKGDSCIESEWVKNKEN